MNHEGTGHAVVLGASMAGLLAARVLADHFERVTVIERDVLPTGTDQRRGVPHGRHLHALHPRGLQIIEELFPAIAATMVDAGAVSGDILGVGRWLLSGHRFRQATIGLNGLFFSRPFLEGHVRARVRELPGVHFLDGHAITALVTTADHATVTGVRVDGPAGDEILADLVVDTTGRGSRTPVWLKELGYAAPAEDRVEIDISYATRTFHLRPDALGDDVFVVHGGTPDNPRMGALSPLEDGRHMMTVGGILGDAPPTDLAGFTAYAEAMAFPDFGDALVGATPLDEGERFRFPANTRRRYEALDAFPARLLLIGDAICSFNPVYGQGMTVAAMEALALQEMLTQNRAPDPLTHFRTIAALVDIPWQTAVGADLAYPEVVGERTPEWEFFSNHLATLHAAAETDAVLAEAFVRVMGLVDPPESLLRPDLVQRLESRIEPTAV
jgi:2-polyprenyl-6-methoxyphenol hydroxylase-like FAD-dependent oxidoreductase